MLPLASQPFPWRPPSRRALPRRVSPPPFVSPPPPVRPLPVAVWRSNLMPVTVGSCSRAKSGRCRPRLCLRRLCAPGGRAGARGGRTPATPTAAAHLPACRDVAVPPAPRTRGFSLRRRTPQRLRAFALRWVGPGLAARPLPHSPLSPRDVLRVPACPSEEKGVPWPVGGLKGRTVGGARDCARRWS